VRPEVIENRFNWWCLSRYGSKNAEFLFKPKIIYPRINNECNFFLDETGNMSLSDNNFFIASDDKFLLAVLNSKLVFYYLKSIASTLQGGYLDFRRPYVETIPIAKTKKNIKETFIEKADSMLSLNKDFQALTQKLSTYICSQYHLEKLSGKLSSWYDLDFSDFIKELNKAIKAVKGTPLTPKEGFNWMELFEENKQKALALKAEIDRTDKEIDQMVYELYGLTEEEIKIVEKS
jgi:hypothetical protein